METKQLIFIAAVAGVLLGLFIANLDKPISATSFDDCRLCGMSKRIGELEEKLAGKPD